MIPSCKDVAELLSQGQDRPLNWVEHVRLRVHLLLCDSCRNFRNQLEFLRTAVRRYRDDR